MVRADEAARAARREAAQDARKDRNQDDATATDNTQADPNKTDRKEARKEAREKRQEARKNRNDSGTANNTQANQNKTDRKEAREQGAEKIVDKRESNQQRRINQGIKNGSLTTEELSALTTQQNNIVSLEEQFKADGKITRDEFKQLNDALNTASRCIFADKHNTDGNQMPVYRLGDNVKLNSDTAAKLADPNLDKTQARQITHDFHEMLRLKHALASDKLTDEQRTTLQNQYNTLLNQYFTVS